MPSRRPWRRARVNSASVPRCSAAANGAQSLGANPALQDHQPVGVGAGAGEAPGPQPGVAWPLRPPPSAPPGAPGPRCRPAGGDRPPGRRPTTRLRRSGRPRRRRRSHARRPPTPPRRERLRRSPAQPSSFLAVSNNPTRTGTGSPVLAAIHSAMVANPACFHTDERPPAAPRGSWRPRSCVPPPPTGPPRRRRQTRSARRGRTRRRTPRRRLPTPPDRASPRPSPPYPPPPLPWPHPTRNTSSSQPLFVNFPYIPASRPIDLIAPPAGPFTRSGPPATQSGRRGHERSPHRFPVGAPRARADRFRGCSGGDAARSW